MAVKKRKESRTGTDKEAIKNYAFLLYMQGVAQTEIAERSGVSQQTITDWKQRGQWEAKKAAKTISIEELANKCLKRANDLLDDPDFDADAFAKAVAQLKTLMPGNTIDDKIMSFMAFQNFLLDNRGVIPEIDETFIKKVTTLQDRFIQQLMGVNG